MQLGLMAASVAHLGWEQALAICKKLELDTIEIPCGAYVKNRLFDFDQLLSDESQRKRILEDVARHELRLSALGGHANPVHPSSEIAQQHEAIHDKTVQLASSLDVDVVICFSGCPGGSPNDTTPNWVTCAWPPEFRTILEYQWNDVLLPFWERKAREAKALGVRLAIEPHPGFAVYNPETLLKLRSVSDNIGVNFDPSHLFWQGIDPIEAVRCFGDAGAIFHIHAKDTAIDPTNTKVNGVLDSKSYGDLDKRSWVFRTCGYGHGDDFWKPFISMLRAKGYDGTLSIEHEDAYMSGPEGLKKAVEYLSPLIIREAAGKAWWF
ncbi:MAG: sugar phosphate isomerase/epimerase family protein [Gemmataceae bacterium]